MPAPNLTIPRSRSQNPALNYALLREEGLKLLQQLSSELWTDYNSHDPGVTLLEALAYALTDLGHRTAFEMRDLIMQDPASGTDLRNFYTLAEGASMKALTINDYRKLLIDILQVKNAWLEKSDKNEVDILVNEPANELQYTGAGLPRLVLNGLYNVLVEFEPHPSHGDLNDNSMSLNLNLTVSGSTVPVTLEFEFPFWEDVDPDFDSSTIASYTVPLIGYQSLKSDGSVHLVKFIMNPSGITFNILVYTVAGLEAITNLAAYEAALRVALGSSSLVLSLFRRFQRKRVAIQSYLNSIKDRLMANRNLCEDFFSIQPMNVQEIGLCLNLEIKPEADADRILAEVYYRVGNFLSPTVPFHTLKEMVEKGYTYDQIFSGPGLNNGFIDNADLRKYQLRDRIYTSDLVQIIMDIPGVTAVNKIGLSNYLRGEKMNSCAEDCLILVKPTRFLPRLLPRRCDIYFEASDDILFRASEVKAAQYLKELKAYDLVRRGIADELDLPEPLGSLYNLEEYASVQEELPLVYGVGLEGLPADANDLRKAQAKQLKGYMLFFEQILANYLSQLSNLRRLFSFSEEPENRTYFTQALFQIPGIPDLIKEFIDAHPGGYDDTDWAAYLTGSGGTYINTVMGLLEGQELYEDRRNRFLDHLIARFNESFSDYAIWAWSHNETEAANKLITDKTAFLSDYPAASAERAKAFDYTATTMGTVWGEADNVSGLKKRVSRLLGFPSYARDEIAGVWDYIFIEPSTTVGRFIWKIKDASSNDLLVSVTDFPSQVDAENNALAAIELCYDEDHFEISSPAPGTWLITLNVSPGFPHAQLEGLYSADDPEDVVDDIINFITTEDNQESFHVLEYILLRPMMEGDALMEIFMNPNCADTNVMELWEGVMRDQGVWPPHYDSGLITGGPMGSGGGGGGGGIGNEVGFEDPIDPELNAQSSCGDACTCATCSDCDCLEVRDPYSFRICVIMPSWTRRFRETSFRKLFRKTVRTETPAHIFVNFLWLNRRQMRAFEDCYSQWLLYKAGVAVEGSPLDCMIEHVTACTEHGAQYELAPPRKVNTYQTGDVIGWINDDDGRPVNVNVNEGQVLPGGLLVNPLNGDLIVGDSEEFVPGSSFNFSLTTRGSNGSKSCLQVVMNLPEDRESVVTVLPPKVVTAYQMGDVLATFTDPDGDIVSITPNPLGSQLPPGTEIDYVTGEITVSTNPSEFDDLIPGTWPIELTTEDENGGTTFHRFNLVIRAVRVATPVDKFELKNNDGRLINVDRVTTGARLFKFNAPGGGVVDIEPQGFTWAESGLGFNLYLDPFINSADLVVEDAEAFKTFMRLHEASNPLYLEYDLSLKITDDEGGITDLTETITIYNNTASDYEAFTGVNYLTMNEEDALAVIGDSDGYLTSWSTDFDYEKHGLKFEQNFELSENPPVYLIVADEAKFRDFYRTQWVLNPMTGEREFSFDLQVVDRYDGVTDLTITLSLSDDPGPEITAHSIFPIPGIDEWPIDYVFYDFAYPDSGDLTSAREESDALDAFGLSIQVSSGVASIKVADPSKLMTTVARNNWLLDGIFPYKNFTIITTNGFGGQHSSEVSVSLDMSLGADFILPLSGIATNDLRENDPYIMWQSSDPADVEIISGSIPPGTEFATNGINMGYLRVSDPAALMPDTYTFTLELVDDGGDSYSADFTIIIPEREFQYTFSTGPVAVTQTLDTDTIVPGLVIDSLDIESGSEFGVFEINVDGNLDFLIAQRFSNSRSSVVLNFTGVLEDNGDQACSGTITILPVSTPFSNWTHEIARELSSEIDEADDTCRSVLTQANISMAILDEELFPSGVLHFRDTEHEEAWQNGDREEYFAGTVDHIVIPVLEGLRVALDASASGEATATASANISVYAAILDAMVTVIIDYIDNLRLEYPADGSSLSQCMNRISSFIQQYDL